MSLDDKSNSHEPSIQESHTPKRGSLTPSSQTHPLNKHVELGQRQHGGPIKHMARRLIKYLGYKGALNYCKEHHWSGVEREIIALQHRYSK